MEGWQVGLIAVIVVGVVVIVYGALKDRRTNERRRREMLAPPERDIPRFSPDAPTPHYLSDLQARRAPSGAKPTDLDDTERDHLRDWMTSSVPAVLPSGYATADLVTDAPTGWAVLRDPAVLLTHEELASVRELLGVMEHQLPTGRPLVIAAPRISRELIDTFAVNHIQQIMTVLPVLVPDDLDRATIEAVTGSTPMIRADLQSGYLAPGMLGACEIWLSTAERSYLR